MGNELKPVIKNDPKKSARKGAEDGVITALSVLISLLVAMQVIDDEAATVLREAMGALAPAVPIVVGILAGVLKFIRDYTKTRRAG